MVKALLHDERLVNLLHAASFGKLHPALADKHYLRTSGENERLHAAKATMQQGQESTQRTPPPRPSTAGPSQGDAARRGSNSWTALRQVRHGTAESDQPRNSQATKYSGGAL